MSLSKKKSGKKNKKQNSKRFPVVMGIIWALIIAAYFVAIVRAHSFDRDYMPKPEYSYARLSESNFGAFFSQYLSVLTSHADFEKAHEYDEILALGEYQSAAVLYNMYKFHDMNDRANLYSAQMEEAKLGVGLLGFATDKIDEVLNLTE